MIDSAIGSQHPDNVLSPAWQTRATANPMFVDRSARNYALEVSSPVRNAGPFGLPPGHTIAGGCYLGNTPRIATAATSESITIGGPGIFAYRWRLDGGTYSAPVSIAPGVFPRTGTTIRTATLALQGLGERTHSLEVIGQDFAGNWQAAPTIATWLVSATPPARYAQWLAWYQLTPGDDSDHDGLDAQQEYGFATSPLISDPQPVTPTNSNGGPAFTFRLPEDSSLMQGHGRPGLTYRVESSEDLSPTSWRVVAEKTPTTVWTGTVTVGAAVGGFLPVTVAIPTGGAQLFLRLGLTPVAE